MSFEFESDEEDSSMPELGCEVSVADLCCDADDEGSRQDSDKSEPRRLTLQQRRRLNLYSKPATLHLPATNAIVDGKRGWAIHDTPTIQEEDSGVGSVTTPENAPDAEYVRCRVRTYSEPTAPAEAELCKDTVGKRNRTLSTSSCAGASPGSRWPKALSLVIQNIKNDAWRDLPVSSVAEEEVLRHRYNPHKRQWLQDRVRVKIESTAFNRGAMRECFRLKKLSTFSRCENWNSRACNYVAKKYIEEVDPSVYFEDVRLQMNAKLWAQEYNRHQPPKKVDIMQMCVIEFINREDSPLYHLEHHIEGDYVKYNSNSGFVDEKIRQTPHALSHFTFERSGHQLIVVDIQGVDDIYTDPQIHTASGTEYGDGNLGVRGMALFFQSHVCNEICSRLGLSSFDLAPTEANMPQSPMISNQTCVRGDIFVIGSPPTSPPSIFDSGCSTDEDSLDHSWTPRRRRNTSGDYTPEEDLAALSAALKRRDRPSCVQGNLMVGRYSRSRSDSGSSDCSSCVLPGMPEVKFNGPVLGRIHHEMARLHDSGRFASDEEGRPVDWEAAVYHEELSAQLGVVEAAVNLARLHLGLPSDCLQDVPPTALSPDEQRGIQYLSAAAKLGDRPSMLQLAKAYDCGHCGLDKDWDKAAHFYQQAITMTGQTDREGGYDSLDTPNYLLSARMAELYLHGGNGLDADPTASYDCFTEAAEAALEQGNGKLATKYFTLAEEAAALIPDE